MTSALPPPKPRTPSLPGLGDGVWRATVSTVDPLTVVIPLYGGNNLAFPAESAVFGTALAVDDPVWVQGIGGTDALAVTARRA